ncbi:MAG: hypothetical protein ACREN8_01050 [Candidatus Dormibacteraceae bacterium]
MFCWNVEIEAKGSIAFDEKLADLILDSLKIHGPALTMGADYVSLRFDIEAETSAAAIDRASEILTAAVPELKPYRVEVT